MTETPDCLVALRRHARDAPWAIVDLVALADSLSNASRAGDGRELTTRTCRHWVKEGVVAPPFGRGRGSSWGYQHLVELLSAVDARERGESLGSIADRRRALSPTELEEFLASRMKAPVPAPLDDSATPEAEMSPTEPMVICLGNGVEVRLPSDHRLASDSNARREFLARLERDINS